MVAPNPENDTPERRRTNRSGLIAAALLFAVLVGFAIYFVSIPSPVPPQVR